MKLYARRGFEWAEDNCLGLWSPVLTGNTATRILDSNPLSNTSFISVNILGALQPNTVWTGTRFGTSVHNPPGSTFIWTRDVGSIKPTSQKTSFTMMGWFERLSSPGGGPQAFMSIGSANVEYVAFGYYPNNVVLYFRSGSQGVGFSSALSAGIVASGINHYALTFDSAQSVLSVYLNGIIRVQYTGFTPTDPTYLTIGQTPEYGGVYYGYNFLEGALYDRNVPVNLIRASAEAGPGEMWQDRPRAKRSYFAQITTFKNFWFRNQQRIIGGGLR